MQTSFAQKTNVFQKENDAIDRWDVGVLQSALNRAKGLSNGSDSDSDESVEAANVWVNSKPSHYYPD